MTEVEEGATECPNCGVELDAESREAYESRRVMRIRSWRRGS
jgi:hypothetical protein